MQLSSPQALWPAAASRPAAIQVVRAGVVDYVESWRLQRALAEARRHGLAPDLILLLEHPPTYTIGRRGSRANLLIDEATVAAVGATCHEIDRGGDITFHGPGQLVAYVIMDLGRAQRSVRRYVERLERVVIETLTGFGVNGVIEPERPGVWVGRDKIAALGIAISHAVSYHGFALNVDPQLRYFDYMIPCGIPDRGATSLARELGRSIAIDEVLPRLETTFSRVFERPLRHDLTWDDLQQIAISTRQSTDSKSLSRPRSTRV